MYLFPFLLILILFLETIVAENFGNHVPDSLPRSTIETPYDDLNRCIDYASSYISQMIDAEIELEPMDIKSDVKYYKVNFAQNSGYMPKTELFIALSPINGKYRLSLIGDFTNTLPTSNSMRIEQKLKGKWKLISYRLNNGIPVDSINDLIKDSEKSYTVSFEKFYFSGKKTITAGVYSGCNTITYRCTIENDSIIKKASRWQTTLLNCGSINVMDLICLAGETISFRGDTLLLSDYHRSQIFVH